MPFHDAPSIGRAKKTVAGGLWPNRKQVAFCYFEFRKKEANADPLTSLRFAQDDTS
jgi:hypothetical protein